MLATKMFAFEDVHDEDVGIQDVGTQDVDNQDVRAEDVSNHGVLARKQNCLQQKVLLNQFDRQRAIRMRRAVAVHATYCYVS